MSSSWRESISTAVPELGLLLWAAGRGSFPEERVKCSAGKGREGRGLRPGCSWVLWPPPPAPGSVLLRGTWDSRKAHLSGIYVGKREGHPGASSGDQPSCHQQSSLGPFPLGPRPAPHRPAPGWLREVGGRGPAQLLSSPLSLPPPHAPNGYSTPGNDRCLRCNRVLIATIAWNSGALQTGSRARRMSGRPSWHVRHTDGAPGHSPRRRFPVLCADARVRGVRRGRRASRSFVPAGVLLPVDQTPCPGRRLSALCTSLRPSPAPGPVAASQRLQLRAQLGNRSQVQS